MTVNSQRKVGIYTVDLVRHGNSVFVPQTAAVAWAIDGRRIFRHDVSFSDYVVNSDLPSGTFSTVPPAGSVLIDGR